MVLNCCLSRDKPAVTWVGWLPLVAPWPWISLTTITPCSDHLFYKKPFLPSFSEEGFDLWIRQWVSGGSSSKGHGGIFPVLDILAIVSINA